MNPALNLKIADERFALFVLVDIGTSLTFIKTGKRGLNRIRRERADLIHQFHINTYRIFP